MEPTPPPPAPSAGLTIPCAVLQLPVSLSARMVLAELWHLWQQYGAGQGLFVPNAHFADRLSLSPRTVGEALHQLAAAGYVRRRAHPSDRRHRLLLPLPLGDTAGPVAPAVPMQSSRAAAEEPAPTHSLAVLLTAQRGGGGTMPALTDSEPAA